eukprot:5169057-Prymnesium_polylepis.1
MSPPCDRTCPPCDTTGGRAAARAPPQRGDEGAEGPRAPDRHQDGAAARPRGARGGGRVAQRREGERSPCTERDRVRWRGIV